MSVWWWSFFFIGRKRDPKINILKAGPAQRKLHIVFCEVTFNAAPTKVGYHFFNFKNYRYPKISISKKGSCKTFSWHDLILINNELCSPHHF